ncbi:uracil-DNA glycosylase [Klebsiella pneumoniae]
MTTPLTWHDVLADEKQQPYFLNTLKTVAEERQSGITIYPPQKDVFNAFRFTELGDVKVVILGQDPYHGPGQAHGLAFSVRPGVAIPPSLLNMYKELEATIPGFTRPTHGYLESWARQGVLLLNTVLTVRAGQAHSHASAIIDRQRHCVLKAPHPSPLSAHRGFFGCNHFVQTNQWLVDRGETPIDWMPVLPAESE